MTSIIVLNIQSLLAHIDEIKYFISLNNPAVLCLTESRITSDIDDFEILIDNYKLVRLNSESRFTGGVVYYIRWDIEYKYISSHCIDKNVWFLVVKVKINHEYYTIAGIYHSPSASHSLFLNFLENWMEQNMLNTEGTLLVLGDFNVNWLSDDYTYTKRLKTCCIDYGLKQIVQTPTHIFENGATIIDLVITNNFDLVAKVLDEPNISDHCIIKIDMLDYSVQKVCFCRSKQYDVNMVTNKLNNIQIDYREPDINKKYDLFYSSLLKVLDEVNPKIEVIIQDKHKGWFNARVLEAIKDRDRKYKDYKINNIQSNWLSYKSSRNDVVRVVRQEKCRYYEEKIDNCKYDPKKMWKSLKSLISSKYDEPFKEIQFGNDMYKNPNLISEKFNEFYISSINDIVCSIPDNDYVFEFNEVHGIKMQNFRLLTKTELKSIIFDLANKSSPDEIDMSFYKDHFDVISDSLINIINSSLENGIVPSSLKVSTIIPIRKVPKTIKAEECRPINMLSAFEKILEKVVYLQFLDFILEKQILNKFQSGFREGYSCESALQYIINEWKEAKDKGRMTGVIFLDLKRAFETVDRKILLSKLGKYGISGIVRKWFDCYLKNRRQTVKCEDVVSCEKSIDVGVPQGSILGPLLFVIYINDMSNIFQYCKYHFFADDTIIYIDEDDHRELVNKINYDLELVSKWLEKNKLKLNIIKTKSMLITNQQNLNIFKNRHLTFNLQEESLTVVAEIKYLGVIVDCNLNFNSHVDYICKKISKKIGILKRVSWYLSINARKTVYNSIILPHFNYCSTILYMANKTNLERLQRLQNRAMRVILKCSIYTRIEDMLKCLNWMNVADFLKYNVLVFIHKINKDIVPEYLKNILKKLRDVHDYNTRGKESFVIKQANKTSTHCSIFYKGVVEYNLLGTELSEKNLNTFKRLLKDSMLGRNHA